MIVRSASRRRSVSSGFGIALPPPPPPPRPNPPPKPPPPPPPPCPPRPPRPPAPRPWPSPRSPSAPRITSLNSVLRVQAPTMDGFSNGCARLSTVSHVPRRTATPPTTAKETTGRITPDYFCAAGDGVKKKV